MIIFVNLEKNNFNNNDMYFPFSPQNEGDSAEVPGVHKGRLEGQAGLPLRLQPAEEHPAGSDCARDSGRLHCRGGVMFLLSYI